MSANTSLAYNHTPKYGAAGSAAGTINGPAIDTAGYNEATVVLALGNATGTLDCKVQDSADGSTGWVDLAGAAFAQKTASDDNTVSIGMVKCDGNLARRYLRIVTTVQATFVADHGVTVLLSNRQYHPDQTPGFSV